MNQISSLLKFIGNKIGKYDLIQGGSVTAIEVPANSYTDVSVTFAKPFSSAPSVICGIYSSSTAGAIGSFTVSAINITATGFTARYFNNSSSARTPAGRYIAIPIDS